jgi:D-glycero-D-manno-heptose 1,7-bisphosphate phosphatase
VSGLKKAVFLDRDGTISEEIGYIHAKDLPRYALLPKSSEGIKKLKAAGWSVVVLTNQSGVARGYFPASQVDAVHARMKELLGAQGASVDGVYYCPHHPEPAAPADNGSLPEGRVTSTPVPELCVDCDCRKPKAGLAVRAAKELGLDLSQSWMVGDKGADLGLAQSAGLKGAILVRTGYGVETLKKLQAKGTPPKHVADDLAAVADLILREG